MERQFIPSLTIALGVLTSSLAGAQEKNEPAGTAPLARFAALAGQWMGKGVHGDLQHDALINYKVTSGGTAVVETIDPGGPHEMVTVIHPDGDALLLTHYCMIGNQPQMKAQPKPGDNKDAFQFVKATNLKSDKDMHMRNVTFNFVDKDTLVTEWTNYDQGKEAGKAVFTLKRKK